ncbi:hypothetical protein G6F56_011343 [Rhizopus delemar]|nr:hypothetical protein G6F56_011343 [Rhizopus delemar]
MEYEYNEEEEERKSKEEHRLWKKNARFLYDLVITQSLEWPSLTCQWFPDVENRPDKNYKTQRLLLGTHTNDEEPNYLMIASVQLPKDNQDIDLRKYEESSNEIGGYGAYNIAEIQITQKIVHEGEVNRARYQFENPNVIATKSRSGEVYVFDRTMHASFPNDESFNPDLRLVGHSQEGYGLAWNPHRSRSTHLISAGYDGIIAHWDIAAASKENRVLSPIQTYKAHRSSVSDVGWHMKYDSVFASVSDDGQLMVWDTRDESYQPINQVQAHNLEANCVEFSPKNEWLLATGSSDKPGGLWGLDYFI